MLRGIAGCVSVSAIFFGVRYLPLADATALTFLAPAFVAAISPCVLHETPRSIVPALLACSLGVLLVTQPAILFGTARLPALGLFFGLLQPFASGVAKVGGPRAWARVLAARLTAVAIAHVHVPQSYLQSNVWLCSK